MSPATSPRRCRTVAAVVVAACAVSAFAPPAAARHAGPSAAVHRLAWRPCRHAPRFDCATARVPLDYGEPGRGTIRLAVIRRRATDPARRIGSLFFHPGLRSDGTTALPEYYQAFPRTLRKRFDIVSWDTRGVGRSTAVRCFRTAAEAAAWAEKVPSGFPVGPREQRTWIDSWARLGQRCRHRHPHLLRHISAADTARDLNLLRTALGNRRLNYLGISYGTFVGATYANLFPGTVRAMVLDSNLDPRAWVRHGSPLPTYLRQESDLASGHALDRFLDLCGRAAQDRCAFSAGTPRATRAKFRRLMRRLREQPQGTWTYARTVTAVVGGLRVVHPGWTDLAAQLQELWVSGAPEQAQFPPARTSRPAAPDSLRDTEDTEGTPAAVAQEPATMCPESPNPRDPWRFPALARYSRARAGDPGGYWTWRSEPCATWPARSAHHYAGPWDRRTAPILTIGIIHDPATPYRDTLAMTRRLADARLLTVKGDGHIALLNPSACVQRYESRYFIEGALPRRGAVCRQDTPPFAGYGRNPSGGR